MPAAFLKKKSEEKTEEKGCACKDKHGGCGGKKHGSMGISKPAGVPHGAKGDGEDEEKPMTEVPPEGGPAHKLHGGKGGDKFGAGVANLAKKGMQDPKVIGASKMLTAKKGAADVAAKKGGKSSGEKGAKEAKKAKK